MKNTFFYSHLIEVESVTFELDELDLTKEQKNHLSKLIDSSLHNTVLDAILSELKDHEKRVFMQHLTEGKHDQIWKFLNSRIDGVETKIKKAAKDLKDKMQKDIEKSKKQGGED